MRWWKPAFFRVLLTGLAVAAAGCSREAKKQRVLERAEKYFSASELEPARVEYLNLLRLEPDSRIATERLGLIWLERGAPASAVPLLEKVRDMAPDDTAVRVKLGNGYLALGKADLAKKEALAIFERSPGDGAALTLLAQTIRTKADLAQAQQRLRGTYHADAAFHAAAAAIAIRAGDIATAKNSALRAIKAEPKFAEAHSLLAGIHELQHDFASAATERKLAAELAPLRSSLRLRYAEYKAQTGEVNEAIAFLQDLTRQAPDFYPAWTALAQIARSQLKHAEALALLQNVLRQSPVNYEANVLRGQVLLAKGETANAIELLEELGKAYPGFAADKYQLACAYLKRGDTAQAVAALQRAIVANPEHEDAMMLLGEVQLFTGNPKPVVNLMVALLTRRPHLAKAQSLLIDALRAAGRPEDAIAVIREQMRSRPDEPQLHFLLGLVLREQNKLAEARASFEQALDAAPGSLPAVAQLVDLDLLQQDFGSAWRREREFQSQSPDSAEAHMLAARVCAAQGKWDEALTALFAALAADENHAAAYQLLAIATANNKLGGTSMERVEAWLHARPESVPAVLLLGSLYTARGELGKACAVYEKHLVAKSDSSAVLNNLAGCYAEDSEQLDRAKALALEARRIEPDSPLIADTLGWILFKRHEYPAALELLRNSAAKLPGNAEVQFHLGAACQATGDNESALAAFRRAAASRTHFPARAELMQRLGELEKQAPGFASGRVEK